MSRTLKWVSLALLSSTAGILPAHAAEPAQAGAPEAGDGSGTDAGRADDTIIVTAQFRGQALQDTPLAISAVTGEQLTARGQNNVSQIANDVPGVTLKPAAAAWGPSLVASIRGVGQYNFNPALEPGVGVFLDDVYYATLTGSLLDLLDVERIEVLRGPQGTLTGRNSIGGAIRIISQRPRGDNSGYAELSGGSRKLVGVRASVDLGLTDTLSARISGALRSQDGYVKRLDFGCARPGQGIDATLPPGNCELGDRQGGLGNQALRGQLLFEPSDRFDVLLSAHYVHESHTGPGAVLTYASFDNPVTNPAPGVPLDSRFICGRYCNFATFQNSAGGPDYPAFASQADPQTRYEEWGMSGTADFALTDDLKLTSITAYRRYSTSFASDDDLTLSPMSTETVHLQHRFFSQEVRLSGSAGALEYTLGGFYSWQKTLPRVFFDIRPYLIQYTTADIVPAKTAAAFATAIYHLTDALTLTGGLRYTHEQKRYTFRHFRLDGSVDDPALQNVSNVSKADVVDYRVSLDYRWSPALLTYFTASSGFKGGGINPYPSAAILAQPFGPEKLKNYEIGFKADLFDRRLRVNTAAFINDYDQIQLTRLSCPEFGFDFCSLIVNAGNAHNKGVEVEVTAEPVDGLRLEGSVSYLDFQFKYINPATGLALDSVPPFTPNTKWSVAAQYRIDLGPLGSLTPRIDAAYQSGIYTNAANAPTNHIDAYTIANAHLTWENAGGDLSVSLHVANLFDKYYFLNSFDLTGTNGIINAQPAAPREFSLVLRKSF